MANSASGTSSSSGSINGNGGPPARQDLRLLSREVSALVTVSNPGPRFSALPSFSDSEEDSGDGMMGIGLGKKRRQRGAAAAASAVTSAAAAGSGAYQYGQQQSQQQLQQSQQQPQQLQQQQYSQQSSASPDCLYDSQGRIAQNGQDACDCLTLGCPGCYYPCGKCGTKCGFECRVGRNSYVKCIIVESVPNLIIRNRLISCEDDAEK